MFSFWSGNGAWQGYKFTSGMALMGAIKNLLLDNYWVFTNVPMSEDTASEPAAKFFYCCGQFLAGAVLWGGVGLSIDYLRSDYLQKNPNEGTRLSLQQS